MASIRTGTAGFWWAIVTGWIGFVVAVIAAILISTQVKAAEDGERKSEAELAKFVSLNLKSDPTVVTLLDKVGKPPNFTVVKQLLVENGKLKNIIIGGPPDTEYSLIVHAKQTVRKIEAGVSLFDAYDTLDAEFKSAKRRITDLQGQYDDAHSRAGAAEIAKTQLQNQFQEAVREIEEQRRDIAAQFDEYRKNAAKQASALEKTIAQTRGEQAETQSRLSTEIEGLDAKIKDLYGTIAKLEAFRRNRMVDVLSGVPDGQIESIVAGQDLVYINLGRSDRIVMGLTFEVFGQTPGVVLNEERKYSGKATIEVMNVFENDSVAQVLRRSPGREVLKGDLIANLAYDPAMTLRFYVFGEFDIDNLGRATTIDRQRIENMIQHWGGKLTSGGNGAAGEQKLTYQTDYLVLGLEPEPPGPQPPSRDPAIIRQYEAKVQKYQHYQMLTKEAIELSIPVLNQNRFLTMVGYLRR